MQSVSKMNKLYSSHFSITEDGSLAMDGLSLTGIGRQFGMPCYVMSAEAIRENCRACMAAMKHSFGDRFRVSYASKALCAGFMYRILQQEGLCADVVSAGELYTALKAGFPAEKLHFNGNNKTPEEIEFALDKGVGAFVIDSHGEIGLLEQGSARRGKKTPVYIRVKPGVEAHTHAYISTGQNDSKFGFGICDGAAMAAVRSVLACPHLELRGLHCHIGSQIFVSEPFRLAASVMVEFMDAVRTATGVTLPDLILGGGFGIRYMPEDCPPPVSEFIGAMAQGLRESCERLQYPVPFVGIEPGRFIAGPAGVTLYTVGDIKAIRDGSTYVAVDGGMADNPRFALYQADYWVTVANRAGEDADGVYTVAGKCCESGDLITRDKPMQKPVTGDTLCVFATGAYNYSMASNYNCICRPPVVLVEDGAARAVVRRQTFADLTACEIGCEEDK